LLFKARLGQRLGQQGAPFVQAPTLSSREKLNRFALSSAEFFDVRGLKKRIVEMSTEANRLPNRTRNLLFDLVPTISFILVFIVIFGAPEGGTFWNRLEKFDGLIAGALAIFAAFITVRQMRKTDDVQDERHTQIMALSLRPAHLTLNRAVTPHLDLLATLHQALFQHARAISDASEEVLWKDHLILQEGRIYLGLTSTIAATLRQEAMTSALPLFDGSLTDLFLKIDTAAIHASETLQKYTRKVESYSIARDEISALDKVHLEVMRSELLTLILYLPQFISKLAELERVYAKYQVE
jgi:hypothetical protein